MKVSPFLSPVVLFLVCWVFQVSAAELSFEEGASRRLREFTEGDVPGLAVLVARDGKIVFQGGFGLADIETKTPITTETKFRIGSISKQFTAAAVLRLAEEGKLSLDDSLDKYVSGFAHGRDVTLRQLLTHTSGIHSYTDKPEFLGRVTHAIPAKDLIAWFRDDPPDFAPGAGFHYNNSGYFLLGEIVAQVSGRPFGDYLLATFFEPLGMTNTGVYENDSPPPNMARGYSFAGEKHDPALDWDMTWAGGAGALYSTVRDLFLWNEALFGGEVLNAESLKAATTPVQLPADVDGMSYGYGLLMSPLKGLPTIGHGGGLNGWSSDLLRVTEQNCTIVVLANALPGRPGISPAQISRSLAEKFLKEEIEKIPPLEEDQSVDPQTFGDYVGRFDYHGGIMTVSVEDDTLFAQITGQPKFRIYPKARDEFFWKVADAQVVFLRDDNGRVNAARHTQGGNTFRAPKLAENPVELTAAQLDAFVGQYQYGPGAVMTISREGTQLMAQLTGQPMFPIFPKSDTEFEWRVVKANVRFIIDDDGHVTKATHAQNGNTFDAPKIKDTRTERNRSGPNHATAEEPGSDDWPEGVIAFASLGTRHWDLYAWRNEEGSAPVTDHAALDFNAAFSPDGERVAFVSRRDGNLELYSMNTDGSALRRLTVHHAMDDHPAWSPDGSRIAFVSTREPAPPGRAWNAIYVMNADGANVRRLSPENASDFSPAWSPSGELIAFTSGNGGGDLYVMNVDGSDRRRIAENGGWPTYLDDGKSIAFHRRGDGNHWDIWRINLDETGLERLAENASMPRATLDGKKMALVMRGGARQQIGVLDLASGALNLITDEETDHWNPAISPDGQTVVYHRTRPGIETPNVEYWEAPPETRLKLARLDGSFPAFSPDHRRVALLSRNFSQVDVMNVDGSQRKTLFKAGHRTMFGMSWSAEPERIAFSHGAVFVGASISVNIKAISPEGDDLTELTADAGNNGFPSYSPDGKQMVFRSGRDGQKNLYIMDRDGSHVRRLTEGDWTDTMCDWSPIGEWIAFASDRDDNYEIWLVRPDGSDLRKLVGGGGRNNHPIFSPDGRWIVFTSQRAGLSAETVSMPSQPQPYGDLFIVRLDGSGLTRLTHNAFEEGTPAWGAE